MRSKTTRRSSPRRRAWRAAGLAAGLLVLPAVAGCGVSVTGHWQMLKAVPNKEVFCVDDATFRGDGTYTATTTLDGKTTVERGTYRFNGFKLILRPEAGGQRSYNAVRRLGRLEILDGDRKVILRKE